MLGFRQLDPEMTSKSDRKWSEKKALILLGGEFAERAYNECNDCQIDIYCSDGDRDEVRDLVQGLFGDFEPTSEGWIRKIEDQVDEIVLKNWERICALATELLARRNLSGDEALQIIQMHDKGHV